MERHEAMRSLILCLGIFFLIMHAPARAADQPLSDPVQEARAIAIGGEVRCVVCQSETINDSQADMARDLRQLVRDKISAGWSDKQILDYIRARYGDFILLRPPLQANTYILWLSPMLFLGLACACVFVLLKRRARKGN
jgi:cytochrome c-type biogenesis protein CcmH